MADLRIKNSQKYTLVILLVCSKAVQMVASADANGAICLVAVDPKVPNGQKMCCKIKIIDTRGSI